MARIRIKNFGPIRQGRLDNDGWLDIKKVSVFIGNQGSGKSCVAKLISDTDRNPDLNLHGRLSGYYGKHLSG